MSLSDTDRAEAKAAFKTARLEDWHAPDESPCECFEAGFEAGRRLATREGEGQRDAMAAEKLHRAIGLAESVAKVPLHGDFSIYGVREIGKEIATLLTALAALPVSPQREQIDDATVQRMVAALKADCNSFGDGDEPGWAAREYDRRAREILAAVSPQATNETIRGGGR